MIRESEILDMLGNKIPEINPALEKLTNAGNIYKSIQCFADFTKEVIGSGNLLAAKRCLNLAEEMLVKGNTTVQNAIENVFLHTLSPLIDLGDSAGTAVKKMLKGSLRREYKRQVCASGL